MYMEYTWGDGSEGAYLWPAIVTGADCEVYKILHGPLEIEKALLALETSSVAMWNLTDLSRAE